MSVRPRRLPVCALWGLMAVLVSCNRNPIGPGSPPPAPVHDHSGTYTLTITASEDADACPSTFPQTAKRRVYVARIQQRHFSGEPELEVYLSGADFVGMRSREAVFTGTVKPAGEIHFRILEESPGDPWWPFPVAAQVVERLSDGTQLVVAGHIVAKRTGPTISGKGGAFNHSSAGRCAIRSFEMVFSRGSAHRTDRRVNDSG